MNKYQKRLYQEWLQHGKVIIAFDFDDTVSPWGFKTSEDLQQFDRIIQLLRVAKETGAYLVVFTSCNEDRYPEIMEYCKSKGLIVDSINKTPLDLPYGKTGKIYANIFLDDRAGLNEALETLELVMYTIRGERHSDLMNDGVA